MTAWRDRPSDVVRQCLSSRGLSAGSLPSGRRTRRHVLAMGAACVVLRDRGMSWPDIARLFGRRSHSSMHHAHAAYCRELWGDAGSG